MFIVKVRATKAVVAQIRKGFGGTDTFATPKVREIRLNGHGGVELTYKAQTENSAHVIAGIAVGQCAAATRVFEQT
ncbi:MAG: hypothetical protein Q8P58_00835 [Candidatus Adlerbacteria bacterium]|nr:hypothetical protein [Candidatus Adlerbacteria bacterium]MDZ4226476.1 hypothetical protein [Patescibacteria group bacterium]